MDVLTAIHTRQSIGKVRPDSVPRALIEQLLAAGAQAPNHHKVRPYRGEYAPMVDAMRKADWIDVTFTKVRFGIPRSWIRDLRATFPLNEAYKAVAMPGIAKYAVSHLSRPLPMLRW